MTETPGPSAERPETSTSASLPALGLRTHVRAAVAILVLLVIVGGVAYPAVLAGAGGLLNPGGSGGSLLHYANGTLEGSQLVGQNLSRPYLFWDRASGTDYNTTLGLDRSILGATDPALLAWLNETLAYMIAYGNFTVNASLPEDFVDPSYSGFDPYLTPEAILVQVPRVALATNESIADLTAFVNARIVPALWGAFGVAYVDVVDLDVDLISWTGVTR